MTETKVDSQYIVLARKYRPQVFEDLLGQDALVQTLTNAINNNKLHHAYILTGIRGVGKTTTARLIAKALNCIGPDGKSGPTSKPCGICENCKSIAEGRNIDVLELDAASRTGVDDVREILDGVRYKPTNSRYKVYIIDEVHMLSKNAFNALLKTLEEPPAHVKFVFATTEIRKVISTVLSRCQRFDLQRISVSDMIKRFGKIVKEENLTADEEALRLIAVSADGSLRDGLSLMDQAISLGNDKIRVDIVKDMLGMADRGQAFEIFDNMISGDMALLLNKLQEVYANGVNPSALLHDLIDITHGLTKTLLVSGFVNNSPMSDTEKEFFVSTSQKVNVAVLSRIWQMLIKGLSELQIAPIPIDAVEMILVRIAYSAKLPSPAEVLDSVKKKTSIGSLQATNAPNLENNAKIIENKTNNNYLKFEDISDFIKYLEQIKQVKIIYAIQNDIEITEFANNVMKFRTNDRLSYDFLPNLNKYLEQATGNKWTLDILPGKATTTIASKELEKKESDKKDVAQTTLVKSILGSFSGAKIETLTRKVSEADKEIEIEVDTEIEENFL